MPLDVTVAVCTYNRAAMLEPALASLMRLESGGQFEFEILVIDNASTDATPEVIEQAAAVSPVPLRGVYEPKPGVSCARNRALAEARGEWIAFFDDDQLADATWLGELLTMAHEKRARCVGGAVRLLLPEGAPELPGNCRAALGESVGMDEPLVYTRKLMPGTGNMLLHASVIDQIGGFDEERRQGGEDSDLFLRMHLAGITAWYTPRAIVRHVIPRYRVGIPYLRWSFQRRGWQDAQRDAGLHGRFKLLGWLAARLVHAALVILPRKLASTARGDRVAAFGYQCRLWRVHAYARGALQTVFPWWFDERKLSEALDFRGERETLAAPSTPAAHAAASGGLVSENP